MKSFFSNQRVFAPSTSVLAPPPPAPPAAPTEAAPAVLQPDEAGAMLVRLLARPGAALSPAGSHVLLVSLAAAATKKSSKTSVLKALASLTPEERDRATAALDAGGWWGVLV